MRDEFICESLRDNEPFDTEARDESRPPQKEARARNCLTQRWATRKNVRDRKERDTEARDRKSRTLHKQARAMKCVTKRRARRMHVRQAA